MSELVLGVIDMQRGFMPTPGNEPRQQEGFAELPVPDGLAAIAPVQKLLRVAMENSVDIFTTQDWHPQWTAHFSGQPDFKTTWPTHCVMGSAGAELHPEIAAVLPDSATSFYKGLEELADSKDDLSYSGYYSVDMQGETLPEWLAEQPAKAVLLGGLALDYCVGKTALDLRTKLGLDVYVAVEATRAISPESKATMLQALTEAGVKAVDMAEAADILQLEAAR